MIMKGGSSSQSFALMAAMLFFTGTASAFAPLKGTSVRQLNLPAGSRWQTFDTPCGPLRSELKAPWMNLNHRAGSPSAVKMSMWSQDDELQGVDRIKACIPYLLPLIDGDQFGRYIYQHIPFLGAIDEVTIGPLADINQRIPFLGLGLFLLLTLGTRFNFDISRNVRYNAQQAALIDISLIIPELVSSSFAEDPMPSYIAEPCTNFVYYAYMTAVVYCIYSNLKGKKPDQVPYISPAADLMTGPF